MSRYLFSSVAFAVLASSMLACGAPAPEARGQSSSKLLAPQALLKGKASSTTTARFGIVEWRMFRGRGKVIFTGYGSDGKAVKGFAVGFSGRSGGRKAAVVSRLLDGSSANGRYEFGGDAVANRSAGAESGELVQRAIADFRALRAAHSALGARAQGSLHLASIAPLADGADCSGLGWDFAESGASCAGAVAGVKSDPYAQIPAAAFGCTAAAKKGMSWYESCGAADGIVNGGTGGGKSYQPCDDLPGVACDDGSSGAAGGGSPPAATTGGTADSPGDASQGPSAADVSAGADAADKASQDTSCASCPVGSGAGDVTENAQNGDVALDSQEPTASQPDDGAGASGPEGG
jgi:hypothetical protein